MAGERRFAFMDASGNVLECSMCKPEFAAEWATRKGFATFEDMDRLDGTAKYLEIADRFDVQSGVTLKQVAQAEVEAFWHTRQVSHEEV